MPSEPCVVEIERIARERTLPPIEAPRLLLGERSSLGASDGAAIVLADPCAQEVVIATVDPGVAASGEAHRR